MDLWIAALLIAGLALMVLEAFVPKIGIFAVTGTICFAVALFILRAQPAFFSLAVNEWLVLSIAAVGLIVLGASIYFVWRTATQALPDPLVGRQVRVIDWQGLTGRVHVDGDTWNAKSTQSFSIDDVVVVTGFDALSPLTVLVAGEK